MTTLPQQIQQALDGRYPLIYCHTPEEDRVLAVLASLGKTLFAQMGIPTWSCTQGFVGLDAKSTDPLTALQSLLHLDTPGFYVFTDLSEFMQQPQIVRALRDLYYDGLHHPQRHVIIISPVLTLPLLLEKQIFLINAIPPSTQELLDAITPLVTAQNNPIITPELMTDVVFSLKGLTLNEARHTLHQVFASGPISPPSLLAGIQASKKVVASRSSFLEYVPPLLELNRIGGLHLLKDWIAKRTRIFNQASLDARIPMPKGVLIMGISGCGKSLSAKVIAKMWGVPLFRLDMNQVFAGLYGTPEATFHKALQIAESVAPVVLWIDEIENGLGFSHKANNASQAQIISAFLTWMQEKKDDVFVAATANNIEVLPAEMIRKGRFDQVFFCDLPDDLERAEIFQIHIALNEGDLTQFDLKRLVSVTQDWNAAEIEQLVIAARVEAFQEQRAITMQDMVQLSRTTIPLSRTMSSQIKTIRDWAWNRATPASRNKGLSLPV